MDLSPMAVGLNICDYVLVEEHTRKLSLIGIIKGWNTSNFPFTPPPFFAHAAVVGGQGDVTITLMVKRLETDEEVYSRSLETHFDDKLKGKHIVFNIRSGSFPAPGTYEFTLLGNGEWIAQCRVQVLEKEEDT